jgi:hypothetical protein
MIYIFAVGFIGFSIGYIIYRRKKQIRLYNELEKSIILQELLENGYRKVDKKKYAGNHQGYQTGFYYLEDPKADLIGYATIECDIPFVKTKGGVKKMKTFSKTYRSLGYVINSKKGFCKELNVDFLLNSTNGVIINLFNEMVSVAKKEGFEPIK